MRFDFNDNDSIPCNTFIPKDLILEMNKSQDIDLFELQKELNYIQFTLLDRFDKVVSLCGDTGYSKETLFYINQRLAKYVIKLVPVKNAYSYIYTYLK